MLTEVLYVKKIRDRTFIVTDAGMADFLRPGLYESLHEIVPLRESSDEHITADIVGPICETTDSFARDYSIRPVETGDFLALTGAGAYGYSLASNYNLNLRPAEVMIDNGETRIIRKRESIDDLLRDA